MISFKITSKQKRLLSVIYMAFAVVFISYKGIIPGWNNRTSDFNNYYVSARLVIDKTPIHQFYDNAWFNNAAIEYGIENGAKFAPFTPFTPFLYVPIAFWDYMTAKRIWLILNITLLIILPYRLSKYFDVGLSQSLLICSLFFVPLAANLNFGQAYLVLGFLLIEAIGRALQTQKITFSIAIITLAAFIKYVPIL